MATLYIPHRPSPLTSRCGGDRGQPPLSRPLFPPSLPPSLFAASLAFIAPCNSPLSGIILARFRPSSCHTHVPCPKFSPHTVPPPSPLSSLPPFLPQLRRALKVGLGGGAAVGPYRLYQWVRHFDAQAVRPRCHWLPCLARPSASHQRLVSFSPAPQPPAPPPPCAVERKDTS